ncbi:hypothetical protein MF628_08380 [Paenibacillus polymyxa]|uniref:hypothetical protein n=1 Tax=Paenibacillus polymyxa TaxID=1406 RepID=UPI0020257713|nr:hypothetical protein [Paenibacillus polymyxa]WDZ64201.1 hypothetical protein MF628_08380 [Paenibacillus polymyxa]
MTTVSIIHGKPYSRETATVFLRSTDNRCDKQRLSALNPVVSRTGIHEIRNFDEEEKSFNAGKWMFFLS